MNLLERRWQAVLRFFGLIQLTQDGIRVALSYSILHKLADWESLLFPAKLGTTASLAVVFELHLMLPDRVLLNAIIVKVTGIFEATDWAILKDLPIIVLNFTCSDFNDSIFACSLTVKHNAVELFALKVALFEIGIPAVLHLVIISAWHVLCN